MNSLGKARLLAVPPPLAGPMHDDDVSMARRAAAGDHAAQRRVFGLLKPRLHATLYRVMGSNSHIEDVLQEAFIAVFGALPSYRGDALLTTWSDRIAIRVAYRFLRRQRAVLAQQQLPPPTLSLVNSTEEEFLGREEVRRLYSALDALNPEVRVAFALFAIDGRSLKEVAEVTGVSLIAVKSRIWRARRQLAKVAGEDNVVASYLSAEEG